MNVPMTCILFALTALAFAGSGCVSAGDGGGGAVAAAGDRRPASGAGARSVLPGVTYGATPGQLERLGGAGAWCLFSGETKEDAAFTAAEVLQDPETPLRRNSLFLRCPAADGTPEWRLVLTSGAVWRPEGMQDWLEKEFRERFYVLHAQFSSDRRHILLLLDPHTYTWFAVCVYDMCIHELRFLSNGDEVEECSDGTLRIKNVKSYSYNENGVPCGAIWHDQWMRPDGSTVSHAPPQL